MGRFQRIYDFNPVVLDSRYWDDHMTMGELAQAYKCAKSTIHANMRRFNIPRRPNRYQRPYWVRKRRGCVKCGTTEIPHQALGHCDVCYSRYIAYPRRKAKWENEARSV